MMNKKMIEANNNFAFFDVDETIINSKTMLRFLNIYYKKLKYGYIKKTIYQLKNKLHIKLGASREELNKFYYKQFKNYRKKDLNYLGQLWFRYERIYNKRFFNESVVKEIKKHQKTNIEVVLVSGSFKACLKPIADYLKVNHILCAELEELQGRYTGKLLPPQTIGMGKAEAIQNFIQKNGCHNLNNSYAYGDHMSDIFMLNLVGNPVVVKNDIKLMNHALNNGWKIIY